MNTDAALEQVQAVAQHPYFWYVVPALFILLCLLLYILVRVRRHYRGIEPFRSQGGRIEIAPQTIRGVIRGAALSVNGVEKAKSKYFQRRRRLQVDVSVHISGSSRLREVETEIKRRIRYALKSQFGMENVDPINIKVKKVIGEPAGEMLAIEPPREERSPRTQHLDVEAAETEEDPDSSDRAKRDEGEPVAQEEREEKRRENH